MKSRFLDESIEPGLIPIFQLFLVIQLVLTAFTVYPRVSFLRAIAFLVSGYVISRVMTIQKRQRQELVEANRRLDHYEATLEQLPTTQERNHMAWELHDTLAHRLSGLAVQLEAADSLWDSTPAYAHALLEEALDSTRHGLTTTRKAIQALRASPLEDLGLSLAIRDLAENADSRAGAKLELNLPPTLEKLSPNIEQCFYCVAQEALENVVRQAGASLIVVDLLKQDGVLALTVTDDGQGFEVKSVNLQHHFGLNGMHERAEMIGGNLEIISLPGKGARIK